MPKLPKIASLLFLCNILRKEVSDDVDVFHADKHESVLQIDSMIFDWGLWSIPKVSTSLSCLYNIPKKMCDVELIFRMQINIKVSYKLISTFWPSRFPTSWFQRFRYQSFLRWYSHYSWAWSSILKVLKITSLQYTSQLGTEFVFCIQINI